MCQVDRGCHADLTADLCDRPEDEHPGPEVGGYRTGALGIDGGRRSIEARQTDNTSGGYDPQSVQHAEILAEDIWHPLVQKVQLRIAPNSEREDGERGNAVFVRHPSCGSRAEGADRRDSAQ